MALAILAVLFGLGVLVWSADRFVEGAASTATHFRMPPLLIGMLVIGFGTSAPEMAVSVLAASQGNPGLALGNAYGSNITNIGLILGLTALLSPIAVHSRVLRRELPVLLAVTLLAAWQLLDGALTRHDAFVLLAVFLGLALWSIREGRRDGGDALSGEMEQELQHRTMPFGRALFWLGAGLVALVASSRLLVWGAVQIAGSLGVSDLVIGLTVVAVGTSLPELAASLVAIRRGEHDLALGNVLGSNLFNTLAVAGLAAAIQPTVVPPELLARDLVVMGALTGVLFVLCYGFRGPGRLNRVEGAALLAAYGGYNAWLLGSVIGR